MAKPKTNSMVSDKDGNSADASKITMPKNTRLQRCVDT